MAESRRQRRRRRYSAEGLPQDQTTEQSKAEHYQLWLAKIRRARQQRKDWEDHYQVQTLERFYLGQHHALGNDAARMDIWMNHFFATVQVQRPAIMPRTVSFFAEPKPGQPRSDQLLVRAQGSVLDTIAQQDDHLMKSVRLAITQAFFRLGVLKTCYEPTTQPNPSAGEPLLGSDGNPLIALDGEAELEPSEIMSDEVYRWRWVNARMMLLPDDGPDITAWTWIGEEIEVPLAKAKEDTRFPKAKREQFTANGTLRDRLRTGMYDSGPRDPNTHEQPMFCYTECWTMDEKRHYILADGQQFEDFLLDEPTPDGVEDHPYSLLIFVPIIAPEPSAWPKPLVYDWMPLQQQYNILREQMINAGKRTARKYYYDDQTFPDADEAQKALESSADMQGVKLTEIGRPPVVLPDPALSGSVAQNIPFLLNDWQRVTGASGARLSQPDADTATEAVIAEQASGLRDSEMRIQMTEWLTSSGSKMLQILKQTMTLDLWIQLKEFDDAMIQEFLKSEGFLSYLALRVGPEQAPILAQLLPQIPGGQEFLRERFGQLKPLKVTRSELQQEAQVKVLLTTARPIYRAQLLQLVSILGPAALMSPTLMEELMASFELPQGERIAEEIMANLQRQQQLAAQQQAAKTAGAPVPGRPTLNGAASPVGTQNPLGAVSGVGVA